MVSALLGPGIYATPGGFEVDLLRPNPREIPLSEWANALSKMCRFGSHLPGDPYSVAQHSIMVARLAYARAERAGYGLEGAVRAYRWGLVHDFHEAAVGDAIAPLKAILPEFVERIEKPWADAFTTAFGVELESELVGDLVKDADTDVFLAEHYDLRSGNVRIAAARPPDVPTIYAAPWRYAFNLLIYEVSVAFPELVGVWLPRNFVDISLRELPLKNP